MSDTTIGVDMDSNKHRTYFELICQGCNKTLKRRSDKKHQSPFCRSCRGRETLTKHNESYARLYKIWQGIKERCNNPKSIGFHRYGGRGIAICNEWLIYENFANWAKQSGYAANLSIDRIDPDGFYEANNCRWVTPLEQSHNRSAGLSWDDVYKIRELAPTLMHKEIAKMFNVSTANIGLVVRNKIWHDPKYVPEYKNRWQKVIHLHHQE